MFSQRANQEKDSAGAAGTKQGPRLGEEISGLPVASEARGRLTGTDERRSLAKPG
jgi:hypothetical protein